VYGAYILLALVAALKQYLHHTFNNYLIFKYTFWHLIEQQPLYINSPANPYIDCNHYGPVFGVFMMPFAVLPDWIGVCLWNVANVIVLLWGIYSLPISDNKKTIIAWICAHEALTSLFSFQFNIALTGTMLLSFSYMLKNKNAQSAFFIAFGMLVKLYGVVSLAYFFFTKEKIRLILYGVLSLAVLFVLPMLFSSPGYILRSYQDWYEALVSKNSSNINLDSFQDISLMGIVRRVFGDKEIPNWPMLLGGLLLFLLPYLRISQYKNVGFRLLLLASTLIFTVIFSTGSESPTYIIAFVGIAVWFVCQSRKTPWIIGLLVFAFIVTSLSPTDIIPPFARTFIRLYALKALPCVVIWVYILYQMLTVDFNKKDKINNNEKLVLS
jgi:hypothetical protein